MANISFYDRVKETSLTSGSGVAPSLALAGAVQGFRAFSSVLASGQYCTYLETDGTDWEILCGAYEPSGNLLSKEELLGSSSATGQPRIVWGSSAKEIVLTLPAGHLLFNSMPVLPGGRLTLTTGTPVTTSDVNTSSSIYYTPHENDQVAVWNGRRWVQRQFTERTLSLSSLTSDKNYDVWLYQDTDAAKTLTLDKTVWTDNTNRATSLTRTDGLWTKSDDKTRLYLGTFRSISTSATRDSSQHRFLWNNYNRQSRVLSVVDTTDSWSTTNATLHSWNSSTANRVEFVQGLIEEQVELIFCSEYLSSATAGIAAIGLDSTSVNIAAVFVRAGPTSQRGLCYARYLGWPGLGYHYLQLLEAASAGGLSGTYYGDAGGTLVQSGASGTVWG